MKLSKFAMAAAFCLASLAFLPPILAIETLFQPNGSVLGNIDSVAKLPPHVVLDYIANCANVTDVGDDDVEFPENADCLFENYVSIQFPGKEYGDSCSPPNVTIEQITSNLEAAASQCPDDFSNFIETASVIVMKVYSAKACFEDLCEDEDSLLRIESQYIEHCADVHLPYPAESEFSMFLSESEAQDYVLTCMLDYIMSTSPFELGLDSSPPIPCWPPSFLSPSLCPAFLAKLAYDACVDNTGVAVVSVKVSRDEWFSMSMHMDNDDYFDGDDYFDDDEHSYDDDDSGDDDLTLFERFCNILGRLSTEQGLACLANICDKTADPYTDMPSDVPSHSPSQSPSVSPKKEEGSAAPSAGASFSLFPSSEPSLDPSISQVPSQQPSHEQTTTAVPSYLPSELSSIAPSKAPSSVPSLSPSTAPSAAPSARPSATPSASPSASPTMEDIQYVVTVSLEGSFIISISSDIIPGLLGEIVEESLEYYLENVNATILSIGLISTRGRRLDSDILVEFLLDVIRECHYAESSDCMQLATTTITSLNETLSGALEGGTLAQLIQDEGTERSIDVLASATVIPDSFSLSTKNVTVETPVIISNPEPVQSSATLFSTGVSFATLALFFLPMF